MPAFPTTTIGSFPQTNGAFKFNSNFKPVLHLPQSLAVESMPLAAKSINLPCVRSARLLSTALWAQLPFGMECTVCQRTDPGVTTPTTLREQSLVCATSILC